MKEIKRDMARIQELVGNAFTQTGSLVALADGGQTSPERLQRRLEKTTEEFEQATLELRHLCERYAPGVGGYGARPTLPPQAVSGHVDLLEQRWLHIQLNTLLPHCRFQTPAWLSDTIRRLLDDYERQGHTLPYFQQATLIIDECSSVDGRHVYDQDNKGWKAVSNAIKGRLIPDDDQYTLSVAMLSARSSKNTCHIILLDCQDVSDFFARRTAYATPYEAF
jgi:hypothetical protein